MKLIIHIGVSRCSDSDNSGVQYEGKYMAALCREEHG